MTTKPSTVRRIVIATGVAVVLAGNVRRALRR